MASPAPDKLIARGKKLAHAATLRPSEEDIIAEMPEGAVQRVEREDGFCEGRILAGEGNANIRRLYDMQADAKRIEAEVGEEANADVDTTKISHPKFGVIDCPAELERTIVTRQGARPYRMSRPDERHVYHPSGLVEHFQRIDGRLELVATEQR